MTVEIAVAVIKDFLTLIGRPLKSSDICDHQPLGLLCWLGNLNSACLLTKPAFQVLVDLLMHAAE
jgi:hypothetical protein